MSHVLSPDVTVPVAAFIDRYLSVLLLIDTFVDCRMFFLLSPDVAVPAAAVAVTILLIVRSINWLDRFRSIDWIISDIDR